MPKDSEHNNPRRHMLPQVRNKNISMAAFDPFHLYLSEIKEFQLLDADEEKTLTALYRDTGDPNAAYRLITSNLRLVVKIALDYYASWAKNFMDLIQEGNLGLLQAVNRFDPDRGTKFSYYAAFWIKAYILKFLLDNWRLVKIGTTQNQRKLFYGLEREQKELARKGIHPEPALLAENLGVKEAEVVEMSQRLQGPEISIDTSIDDQAKSISPVHLTDEAMPIDEQLSQQELRDKLLEKVEDFGKTLSGREAFIFKHRLMSEDPLTLQKIADKYNLSRERVRQVQKIIIQKITAWLHNEIPNFRLLYGDMVG
ncbi:MAG: RNA polymerase factor sigma-32 [Deltaproteobacteria bacterium]|nr:RNA polymerase factor sigma-32 [Deltaproteobacteria bacterium]